MNRTGLFGAEMGCGQLHGQALLAAGALVMTDDEDLSEAHLHQTGQHGLCVRQIFPVAHFQAPHLGPADEIHSRPIGQRRRNHRLDLFGHFLRDTAGN